MKKTGIFLAMLMVLAVSAFAQNFTVQEKTGRVQRESGANRIDISAGETLAPDTIIHTGVGATLILKQGERTFEVPAARNGRLSELVTASSGVRITGNVARVDTGAVGRTTGQAATASARASDAAADDDIAAE